MDLIKTKSDHLNNWSDNDERKIKFSTTAKKNNTHKKPATSGRVLRRSVIERYKRCGKPGCKCARSRGHGPKYYLSVSKPKQRPVMDYIPLDYHAQVTEYVDNFRQIKTILEELCEINRELLKRREKL